MMKAWRIVGWLRHYEANDQGRPVEAMSKARARALPWVRLKVNGRSQSDGYRLLQVVAGTARKVLVAYGVFCKLLELAADQPRNRRGWILDGDGRPADPQNIAWWAHFSPFDVSTALSVLSDKRLRWIEETELPQHLQVPTGTDRNLPSDETRREGEGERDDSPPPTSPQGEERLASPFTPDSFARSIEEALQLGKGNAKQTQADLRDFKRIGEAILAEKMGDRPATAAEACLTAAREFAQDKEITNKAGYWLTWARAQMKGEEA